MTGRPVRALLSAASFLTIAPVPAAVHRDRRGLREAAAWFPLVGAGMGAASLLVVAAGPPHALGVAALVALPFVLTRAIHLDGLADACDGLFAGGTPATRRRIMRDPRVGSFGALAIALDVVTRAVLVSRLLVAAPTALLVAPALSRWALTAALGLAAYDPRGGLKAAGRRPSARSQMIAAAVPVLLMLALGGWRVPLAASWAAVAALAAGWIRFVRRRVGTVSGDALGALNELAEMLVYAVFVAAG